MSLGVNGGGVRVGVGGVVCGVTWFSTGAMVDSAAGLSEKVPVGRQDILKGIMRLANNHKVIVTQAFVFLICPGSMFHLV